MKKYFLTIVLAACCFTIFAQDVIYVNPREVSRPRPSHPRMRKPPQQSILRDYNPTARIIMGKVTEITPTLVIYKKDSDAEGRLYSTPLLHLDSIVLANGTVHRYTGEYRIPEHKKKEKAAYAGLNTNIIYAGAGVHTYRLPELFFSSDNDTEPYAKAFISYEKIFASHRLGVEAAPFAGINRKAYGALLHAKFYVKNSGRFRLGVGPFFNHARQEVKDRLWVNENMFGSVITRKYDRSISTLGMGVSMHGHASRNLLVRFNFAFGGIVAASKEHRQVPASWQKRNSEPNGYLDFRLGLGYRF